mgnify:FL=1
MHREFDIGTFLYQDETSDIIYELYKDYFVYEKGMFPKYILTKKPDEELKRQIMWYYCQFDKDCKRRNAFIDYVSKEVLKELDEEDKEYIYMKPDSSTHHDGLSVGIRNVYIWGKDIGFYYGHADSLSSEIFRKIASMIVENYEYENPLCRRLYDDSQFTFLRQLYYYILDQFPGEIVNEYKDMLDDEEAKNIVIEILKSEIYDVERFKLLCKKYNVSDEQCKDFIEFIDKKNEDAWKKTPYDIGLLVSKELESDYRKRLLEILHLSYLRMDELPMYMFNQKDMVVLAVKQSYQSYKKFPEFQEDEDIRRIVREARKRRKKHISYFISR